MDEIDRGTLWRAAPQTAGASLAELGRRVNLSSPAVAERVKRLEAAGVLLGYLAGSIPRCLRLPANGNRSREACSGPAPRSPSSLQTIPEVVECPAHHGEDCFYLKVESCARSTSSPPGSSTAFSTTGQTTTSIVNDAPIPRRDPPIV